MKATALYVVIDWKGKVRQGAAQVADTAERRDIISINRYHS
jgi:hypothetical protein